jgi:YD repeat-containing protein
MRYIFLALSGFMFTMGQVFSQGITRVEINGPGTAAMDAQTLFTVTFWDYYSQVPPPQYGSYYWDFTGASLLDETKSSLRLNYYISGGQMVNYEYSTFDNYYSDYVTVQVDPDYCTGVNASAQDVSRTGPGTVTLTADPAPSGFTYKWYASDQNTLLSNSQSYTTPSLSATTTYYLAYQHTGSGCLTPKVPVRAVISDRNYVKKYTAREATTSEATVRDGTAAQSYKDFTYYDGLGRPMQNDLKQASVSGWDIITPIAYDSVGRQAREYLPYARSNGTGSGAYQETALQDHSSYYSQHYADTYGYSEKQFEPSPLNRVGKQAAPGNAWKLGSGRETEYAERPNTAGDEVRIWTVNSSGLPVTSAAYAAGALWVKTVTDENNSLSVEYMDKQGRVVLKKAQSVPSPSAGHQGWLCAYYVYDDFGRLRVVIPPKAVRVLDSNWGQSTDTTLANAQYFQYKYDGRGRVTEKQVPGKGVEYYLYNIQDRMVGSQNGNLRLGNKWLYTKYDALGRVVMTGITSSGTFFAALQTALDSGTNNAQVNKQTAEVKSGATITSNKYDGYREYVAGSQVILKPGFSFRSTGNQSFTARIGQTANNGNAGAWPIDEGEILTVTYYDSYSYLSGYTYAKPASPYPVFYVEKQADQPKFGMNFPFVTFFP